MSIINRITATIGSKVETIVSHVEDHDAVVDAMLRDTRSALAKARVRLNRVNKDGEALHAKLNELAQMKATWEQRAKSVAKEDETRALECIGRRNVCQQQIERVTEAIAKHKEVERKTANMVTKMEQRLEELTGQRNLMRSRHSAADAMRVISKIEDTSYSGIDDAFDRWEMQIIEAEYQHGTVQEATDTLDASFVQEENAEVLKADLDALLGNNTKDKE